MEQMMCIWKGSLVVTDPQITISSFSQLYGVFKRLFTARNFWACFGSLSLFSLRFQSSSDSQKKNRGHDLMVLAMALFEDYVG